MFRITQDPSSGSIVQCLAKHYKNDSIVSVGSQFAVYEGTLLPSHAVNCTHTHTRTHTESVTTFCHNTDLVHVNRHDRIIPVISSQALYNAP